VGALTMASSPLVSSLPGRLRVRHPILRSARRNAALAAELEGWEGVTAATGTAATGGILLLYDSGRVAPKEVEARVLALLVPHPAPGAGPDPVRRSIQHPGQHPGGGVSSVLRTLNRPAKVLMIASMAGSLAALSISKKAHAALGVLHLAVLLIHLAHHRSRLLR